MKNLNLAIMQFIFSFVSLDECKCKRFNTDVNFINKTRLKALFRFFFLFS
jgi:hypothetical protein